MRHDEDNELLSDAIRVVYVELSKLDEILKKSVSDMTDLEKWAVFFQYASVQSHRETVNRIIASKEVLKMAGNLLMSISQDEKERAVFRSCHMYQTDLASNLATAEDRGEKRGERKGILNVACNALRKNMSVEDIIDITGLSHEEVESLRNNN